jgi:trk system potassium uptake protein
MYIIIIGCGRIGSYLANLMQDENNVVVIDKDEKTSARLGESFNGLFIKGDGLDPDVLKDAGIEKSDALAVTTSNDNTNIVIAQIAKKIFNVPKVVARVSNVKMSDVYRNLGVDPVNSTAIFSTLLREKIFERNFTTYIFESDMVSILEIKNTDVCKGKQMKDLNIPGEFQIITVVRGENPIIPDEKTVFEESDTILGIVRLSSLKKVKKFFKLK